MNYEMQSELRREENMRLCVKIDRLQAAGDELAEEVTDAIDTIRTAVRLMTTADGMKLLNDKIDKLKAKLTAWTQAKEMR